MLQRIRKTSSIPIVMLSARGENIDRINGLNFQREHQKLARLCATEGVDHVCYLFRLAEREMIERDRRKVARRIKAAKFPVAKSLNSFDFTVIPKLNKMQVLELARCEWIERRENVIAIGPSGTGKTHVALSLRLATRQKGLSVGVITAG